MDDLIASLQHHWNIVQLEEIHLLVLFMPRCVREYLTAKYGHSRYWKNERLGETAHAVQMSVFDPVSYSAVHLLCCRTLSISIDMVASTIGSFTFLQKFRNFWPKIELWRAFHLLVRF